VRRFVAAFSVAALLAAGCGGGGSGSTPTTFVATTPAAALDYVPGDDSFAFENFGGGQAPAELTVNLVRRLYGDSQVCASVVENRCTPHPVVTQLIQQANRSMAAGLCEGFAVLALRLAADPEELAALQADATKVAEMVKANPALLSELAYWYTTQFASEVQAQAEFYLEKTPVEIAAALSADFADGGTGTGFTLGIYSSQGGHALTPYKVESGDGTYRVFVYDSNWPGAERWIDVNEDGWVYALAATNPTEAAAAWQGGAGTMELTPMSARRGPFTCPFCPQEGQTKSGTLMTVAASGDSQLGLQVQDQDGNRLGIYDGEMVNEIPGATYRYLISAGTADPVLVFLPPSVETYTADVTTISVAPPDGSAAPAGQRDEPSEAFSLLVLDEGVGVQIDAEVHAVDAPPVEESLLAVAGDTVEVNDDTAVIGIAVGEVLVEIALDEGEEFAVEFTESTKGETAIAVEIVDAETDVVVAEATIDTATVDEEAPVEFVIDYDEDVGITVEEDAIEEWVASDAEYFQAVAEDRVAEVMGEEFAADLEADDWRDEEALVIEVEDEYWEDERWEPDDYDEEYYEEESVEWEEFDDWVEEDAFEEWAEDDPLAQGASAPILLGTEPVERTTLVRSWTETEPETVSTATSRTEVHQDEAGTLTEVWTDTAWEIRLHTTSWTETLTETGTSTTYSDGGQMVVETSWETATATEASQTSSEVTDAWTTSDLAATNQDCLFRQSQLETMPFVVRSDASSRGSDRTARSPLSASSMKAGSLRYRVPSSAMPSSSIASGPRGWLPTQNDPWENDTNEKPSGCATPGTASTVAREDAATTTSVSTTVTAEAAGLEWIDDGFWYDEETTVATTVTTYTDVTTVEWSDGYTAITAGTAYDVTTTATSVNAWSNDCALTGGNNTVWTGFGDFCIVDVESGTGGDDEVTFTLTETTTVQITAATLLTCDGWPGTTANGEADYGDPYVYLYDSGGNLLESDDDDGCTCAPNCPDSGNCWDSYISRALSPGTYSVKGRVYSANTAGWYRLTIDMETST
jgi:hypothetical protein